MTDRPGLLTVAEVARRLRVSRMTIYRLIHCGALGAIKVRGAYRVPAQDLEAYLAGAYFRAG